MNTINMTVTFSEEDRQRIDELIAAALLLVGELKERPQARITLEAAPDPEPPVEEPVVEPTPEPVAETAPEVKPVSFAEFQKAVTLAVSKGPDAKKAVKALINEYADSVSAVPEDKRAEVMTKLASI